MVGEQRLGSSTRKVRTHACNTQSAEGKGKGRKGGEGRRWARQVAKVGSSAGRGELQLLLQELGWFAQADPPTSGNKHSRYERRKEEGGGWSGGRGTAG